MLDTICSSVVVSSAEVVELVEDRTDPIVDVCSSDGSGVNPSGSSVAEALV